MQNNSIHNNKKVYKLAKLSEKGNNPFNLLNLIKEAVVDSYPWDDTYTPKTTAKIFYTESRICVSFKTWEEKITATYLNINDPVYKDSCVEFFFNPNPEKDKRYFNLEMNPFGTFLLGIGEGRQNRTLINDITPDTFYELFQILLGDNGSEFSNPSAIERDLQGNQRARVFYCDPQAPFQKGAAENNHALIRRIIPKGTSLDCFTQKDITLMMSHVNSYARPNLGDKTPYGVFASLYREDILRRMGLELIPPDKITLRPSLLKI